MTRLARIAGAALWSLTQCGGTSQEPPGQETCGNDVPIVTWSSFGQGFLSTYCQGCHASRAADRRGAPANVVFDAKSDALGQSARILARAAGDAPTMPPAGGPPASERQRLSIWLGCFPE